VSKPQGEFDFEFGGQPNAGLAKPQGGEIDLIN